MKPARSPLPMMAPWLRGPGIDWAAKRRHFLQILAFALAISGAHYAFRPDMPYLPALAHAGAIATSCWLIIDFGRHAFASAQETGWPRGASFVLLVVGGNLAGYFLGSRLADALCDWFGWYGATPVDEALQLRTTVLISAIAGVVGSYWFYSRNQGEYLRRKMAQAQQHATEARLALLQAQLEPHMLFNTLANLRALIAVDPPRAQRMLDHAIGYLRSTLAASRATTHPLQDEFARLHDYLALMAVRMGPRLSFGLALPPELADHPVPTLLLQPLVENAILHGLEPQVEGGRLDVRARLEGGQLVLDVVDSGAGLDPGAERGWGSGFGLEQVRARLAALYGSAAALELGSAEAGPGTRACIRLPAQP